MHAAEIMFMCLLWGEVIVVPTSSDFGCQFPALAPTFRNGSGL
jgi:hypothetical protein